MREVKRYLALLSAYFTQYVKVRVSYRGDFLISLATSIAATIFASGLRVCSVHESAATYAAGASRKCCFSTASR